MKLYAHKVEEFNVKFSREKVLEERWIKLEWNQFDLPLTYCKKLSDHWEARLIVSDSYNSANLKIMYTKNINRYMRNEEGAEFSQPILRPPSGESATTEKILQLWKLADDKIIKLFCVDNIIKDSREVILLPCPCCGEAQEVILESRPIPSAFNKDLQKFCYIHCNRCGLHTRGDHPSKQEAIDAWNKRVVDKTLKSKYPMYEEYKDKLRDDLDVAKSIDKILDDCEDPKTLEMVKRTLKLMEQNWQDYE